MPTARNGVGAIEGPDGRLWAAGGNRTGSLDVVEAYFPKPIDKWVDATHLLKDRSHCSAQLHPDGRLIVFGGLSSGLQPQLIELYGPVVAVSPTMLGAGANAQITGDNFAADAGVTLRLLSGDNPVLGRGSTDAKGALESPISFTMPQVAAGTHRLQVVDSRSRYPIVLEVVVTQ